MFRSSSTSAIVGIVGGPLRRLALSRMQGSGAAPIMAALGRSSPPVSFMVQWTIIVVAQVNKSQEMPTKIEIAADARGLVRRAFKGSLATIAARNGYPYASLDHAGDRRLGRADLADLDARPAYREPRQRCARLDPGRRHWRARRSAARRARDALRQGREGVGRGSADGVSSPGTRKPPSMPIFPISPSGGSPVEGAHYIGGFGRIFDLTPDELLLPLDGADALIEAEPGIVAHMNDDHADAIALYATGLPAPSLGHGAWCGIDPEGCDLVLSSARFAHSLRRADHHPCRGPQGARPACQRGAGSRRLTPRRLALKALLLRC